MCNGDIGCVRYLSLCMHASENFLLHCSFCYPQSQKIKLTLPKKGKRHYTKKEDNLNPKMKMTKPKKMKTST